MAAAAPQVPSNTIVLMRRQRSARMPHAERVDRLQAVLMGRAQLAGSFPAINSRAFDELLVGACGVQRWSQVLNRRLDPDTLALVESYVRPRIAPHAAAMLRSAAEDFLIRLFQGANTVAIGRGSRCVWALDVEDALFLSGDDRIAGVRRPAATACACAGTVEAAVPRRAARAPGSLPESSRYPEAGRAPSVTFREESGWCDVAADGTAYIKSIRTSLRWIALRGGAAYVTPDAFDTACSAMVGFLRTALACARGDSTPLLRDLYEADATLATLRALVYAHGRLDSNDASVEDDSASDDSEDDEDDCLAKYAWVEGALSNYFKAFGSLTTEAVGGALQYLGASVAGQHLCPKELGADIKHEYGSDVLDLIRMGELPIENYLNVPGGEKLIFGDGDCAKELLKLDGADVDPRTVVGERRCCALATHCPICGTCRVLRIVEYGPVQCTPKSRLVDRILAVRTPRSQEEFVDAMTRAEAAGRWDGVHVLDLGEADSNLASIALLPENLNTFSKPPVQSSRAQVNRFIGSVNRFVEKMARHSGIAAWHPEVERFVQLRMQHSIFELVDLANVFRDHDEGTTATAAVQWDPRPLPLTYVARAMVSLLEDSVRHCHAVPLLWFLSEVRVVLHAAETGMTPSPNLEQFDPLADDLVQRYLLLHIAYLFHRARRICPETIFGPTLTPYVVNVVSGLFGSLPMEAFTLDMHQKTRYQAFTSTMIARRVARSASTADPAPSS